MSDQETATATAVGVEQSPEDRLAADKALFEGIVQGTPAEVPDDAEAQEIPESPFEASEEAPAEAPETPEAEAPESVEPNQEAVEARKSLLIMGVPASAIEAVEDDKVVAWWNATQAQAQPTAAEPEPEPPAPAPMLDLEGFSSKMKERYGEEEGQGMAEDVAEFVAPLLNAVAELKSTWQTVQEQNTRTISASNRSRLMESVPQLANDRAWSLLEQTARDLVAENGRAWSSAEEVFDQARREIYGDVATVAEPAPSNRTRRAVGLPTTENRKAKPAPMSPAEEKQAADWAVFQKAIGNSKKR